MDRDGHIYPHFWSFFFLFPIIVFSKMLVPPPSPRSYAPAAFYYYFNHFSLARVYACAPHVFDWGQWYDCAPPPHTFNLELYLYITLTNNSLEFFIYQSIILWTISTNWHRWVHKLRVCVPPSPPPPPPPPHTHFLAPSYATVYIMIIWYPKITLCYRQNRLTRKSSHNVLC